MHVNALGQRQTQKITCNYFWIYDCHDMYILALFMSTLQIFTNFICILLLLVIFGTWGNRAQNTSRDNMTLDFPIKTWIRQLSTKVHVVTPNNGFASSIEIIYIYLNLSLLSYCTDSRFKQQHC